TGLVRLVVDLLQPDQSRLVAAEEGEVGTIGHAPLVDHLAAADLGALGAHLEPDGMAGGVGLLEGEVAEEALVRRRVRHLGPGRAVAGTGGRAGLLGRRWAGR